MAEEVRWELKTCAQYFAIALIAGVGAFVSFMPDAEGGEIAIAVNIGEAWRNYMPVLGTWLLVFAILSIIRLLILYTVHHKRNKN